MKFLVIEQDLRVSGTSQGIISRSFLAKLRLAYPQSIIDVVYLKQYGHSVLSKKCKTTVFPRFSARSNLVSSKADLTEKVFGFSACAFNPNAAKKPKTTTKQTIFLNMFFSDTNRRKRKGLATEPITLKLYRAKFAGWHLPTGTSKTLESLRSYNFLKRTSETFGSRSH